MAEERSGASVTISLREIYDSIQDVRNEVKGIGPRLTQLEKDAAKGVEAHDIASKANEIATKHEDGLKWLWRTVIGAFITGIVAAIIGFMVLAAQLSIQNQIKAVVPQNQSTSTQQQTQGGNK